VVICVERGADCLRMVQLMLLHPKTPPSLLAHLNPDWLCLSGTGLPRLSWKEAECGIKLNDCHCEIGQMKTTRARPSAAQLGKAY